MHHLSEEVPQPLIEEKQQGILREATLATGQTVLSMLFITGLCQRLSPRTFIKDCPFDNCILACTEKDQCSTLLFVSGRFPLQGQGLRLGICVINFNSAHSNKIRISGKLIEEKSD